ncbi:hypothetical protein NLU13_7583 [Sarocladium strictum]|uniref:Atg28p n=1 Tax=Sarocladium strictum TaxID=5046 RepID=A0AA39GD22_SARSR|nr:hypothetical protein NLU13_7583 [Sarocladium strictum]
MSQSFFDRLTSSRRASLLPLHSPPQRLPGEYDLDELEPRPDDRLLSYTPPRGRLQSLESDQGGRRASPEHWNERASSIGSVSKFKDRTQRAMFTGPPPPIASSAVLDDVERERAQDHKFRGTRTSGHPYTGSSVLFDQRVEYVQQRPDSAWRILRRQEKAIETDVQHLLDVQANGLIAGLGGRPPNESDLDEHSDAGSSTPTGTFYSTATSKSRMVNSLHIPTRANADGNVIPVRQPKKTRPPGLSAARSGLRKSMLALANLKTEEDAHVDDALAQRKSALAQLDLLSSRRNNASKKLQALEHSEEEPLGLALRELGTQYDSLTQEIHDLEEKLVGMRNRRRVVRAQMDDVKSQREAGLSGFRGALRDVENDMADVLRRPPIQPLDPEIFDRTAIRGGENDEQINASVGNDFLRMIPERRTAEMARSWWQAEIAALERRKVQIESEHHALEEGGLLWLEVMALVTDFESRLRKAMKTAVGDTPSDTEISTHEKGKGKIPSQEDVIREQLPLLEQGIDELEGHMHTAETKGWNLLICAIGAELEAFREAQYLLREAGEDDNVKEEHPHQSVNEDVSHDLQGTKPAGLDTRAEDSDENEVPDDLLVSGIEQDKPQIDSLHDGESESLKRSVLRRVDSSDNDVPAEFFAEHDKLD